MIIKDFNLYQAMSSSNTVTLKKLAMSINPDWDLNDWFKWPPNLFGLCSLILNRTGSYKICLLECDWWNNEDWQKNISNDADKWIKYSCDLLLGKDNLFDLQETKVLKDFYPILKEDWDGENSINVDSLRVLGRLYNKEASIEEREIKDFAKAIVLLTVVADTSCAGLGFLGQPLSKDRLTNRLYMAVANLLLNTTGSLSTIPKFYGVVLPKMRTPQSGLVARSLTHHLTFHTTEVEIMWRTFPWLNNHRQNLNILSLPYPTKVYKTDFEIVPDNYQVVRYFKGSVKNKEVDNDFLTAVVEKVGHLATIKNEVDVLVFPEMSLTELQYNVMLRKFSDEFYNRHRCLQLPIIIAGVIKENTEKTGISYIDETFHNEVRMAIFFAGRWYDVSQRKHHRWQLDRGQIQQYKLEGYFPADRKWFELSSISQRRLTILVPNSWLALTALICEDLARQEPVSEVIRGIGPTLLFALLSDGPQLNNRWSARYASVLADDPGTAVLSLTSQGMADRSQPSDHQDQNENKVTIGLWKDMIRGWKELQIEGENDAIMFTISASYKEEFTLDGRSDGTYASVFQMDSIAPKQVKLNYESKKQKNIKDKKNGEYNDMPKGFSNEEHDYDDLGRWNDIRELSGVLFSIDAILDILTIKKDEQDNQYRYLSIDIILDLLMGVGFKSKHQHGFINQISYNISSSWENPNKLGIEATVYSEANEDMKICIDEIRNIINGMLDNNYFSNKDLYEDIIARCEKSLVNSQRSQSRVLKVTAMGFLYNLNTRISNWHLSDYKSFPIDGMDALSATKTRERTNSMIATYLRKRPDPYRN